MQTRLRDHGAGLAIALAAVLLRAHQLPSEFTSSDAATVPALVLKAVCSGSLAAAVEQLGLFRLGGVHTLALGAYAAAAEGLDVTLSELGWLAPVVVLGGAATFMAYLFARELAGKWAGWAAAALIAVSPIHMMSSRHLGAPWSFEIYFQLTLIWLLVRLERAPSASPRRAFHFALAAYLWCGNQMLGIFPVIGWVACCGLVRERGLQAKLRYLRSRFGSRSSLVLLLSAAALGYFTLLERRGHLAHALFHKRRDWGWHFSNWYSDLVRDIGLQATWIALGAGVLAALLPLGERYSPATRASRPDACLARLPLVYFAAYTLPFWLFIGPRTTLTAGYVVYSITGLLLLTAITPFQLAWRLAMPTAVPVTLLGLIAGLMLAAAGDRVFKHYRVPALGVKSFQGAYVAAKGAAAAAAFVKQHSDDARARVFSDASRGGLEPPNLRLYFRRPHFALLDASPEEPFKRFRKRADEIDYLVVKPENRKLVRKYFGERFAQVAEILPDAREGALLLIYAAAAQDEATAEPPTVVTLRVSEGRERHRELYPSLCTR